MAHWRCWLVVIAVTSAATRANAQDVTLNTFAAPLTTDDGIALNRPHALFHREMSALVTVDYANDPLVVELESGDAQSRTTSLVAHEATTQARFAIGLFNRLVLGGGLDAVLAMSGDRFVGPGGAALAPADGPGIGDLHLSARYVPVGDASSFGAFALQARVILPLAEAASPSQRLSGEGGVAFRPELLGELRPKPLRLTANLGFVVRESAQLLDAELGNQLTFGAGIAVGPPGKLKPFELLVEAYGATALADAFGRASTPAEVLFGARARVREHWRVSLAAGPGISFGVGAPDYRVLTAFGLVTRRMLDRDADEIDDRTDACPTQPEDRDDVQDGDGCPDDDDDHDGVADARDYCPDQLEDVDKFEDDDGCPEPDNDRDGLDDRVDTCPLEAEDRDGFEDENGCPDRG
jgi:hypothetical protein